MPESRQACALPGSEPLCVARCIIVSRSGGYCDDKQVCNCRD